MNAGAERARLRAEIEHGVERARGFAGWTFDVDAVHLGPPIPWDYAQLARDAAMRAERVLDLGTGGGERLAEIVDGLPCRVVATEEWEVNAPIAARRLRGRGADVARCSSLMLPFAAGSVDLVLDRHEALEPSEVARVLAPGGAVITQQCGPDDWPELREFFPRKTQFGDHFRLYREGFESGGLQVADAQWHDESVAFGSLADVVYLLIVTPWNIPDFDPLGEIDALAALERALRRDEGLVLTESRYLIRAHKPA